MKKALLTMFMAVLAFWVSAQSLNGIFVSFGTRTDSSITINGRNLSGVDFFVRAKYLSIDSTGAFNFGPLVYQSAVVDFPYSLHPLAAQGTYRIMLTFYNDSLTDSLTTEIEVDSTMAAPPTPIQAVIWNARLVPGFPTAMVIFNDSSVGYQNTADLEFASSLYAPTPYSKVIGPGVHTDTISFPTTAGDSISEGFVFFTPVGNTNMHVGRSNLWNAGVCPGYSKPVIHWAANPFHNQDSLAVNLVIDSLGNANSPILVTRLNTLSGRLITASTPHQINGTGTINFPKGNLSPDSTYIYTAILANTAGADSEKVTIHLDPMDLPTVVLDTLPITTSHSYWLRARTNPVDTFALAQIKQVYLKEGTAIIDSGVPVNNIVIFNENGKSANTNYTCQFIVKNFGGHTATSSPFSVITKQAVAPRTEPKPVVSNLRSGPSATMVDISYVVTPGDTLIALMAYSQTQGTSVVDSELAGQMLTQSGTIYGFTFSNQTALTGYCYSAMSLTADSITEYGNDSCQFTSGGTNPMLFGITQTMPILNNSLKAVIHGSAGGSWSMLTYWLTNSNGVTVGNVDTAHVGTGEVTKSVEWDNLPTNQRYCVNAYISLIDGNLPSPTMTECYWVGTATDVQDLKINGSTDHVFVDVTNVLGQRVVEHMQFGDVRRELPKGQVFMVQSYNEDGILGKAQKFVF